MINITIDVWERALFEEKHVANLCKQFGFGSAQAADTVHEYAMYKKRWYFSKPEFTLLDLSVESIAHFFC